MTDSQPDSTASLPGAYIVALVGFLFCAVVSILFNVMDAMIPTPGVPQGWAPSIGAIFGAAIWPVLLIISVELMSRTGWPDTVFARIVRYGLMGAVAVFAATISYQHIREVLLSWRYNELSSNVGPLALDGVMVLAGYAMVLGSKANKAKKTKRAAPKTGTQAAPELPAKSEPGPTFGDVFKPLPMNPKPPVRNRTNGIKPAQARRSAGPSTQDIVERLRERGTTATKRAIIDEFSVGSKKAQEALNLLKEGDGDV